MEDEASSGRARLWLAAAAVVVVVVVGVWWQWRQSPAARARATAETFWLAVYEEDVETAGSLLAGADADRLAAETTVDGWDGSPWPEVGEARRLLGTEVFEVTVGFATTGGTETKLTAVVPTEDGYRVACVGDGFKVNPKTGAPRCRDR